ncbi:MAG: hypothetical protein NY202_05200 [Mollicutes bacterium UO1]
MSLDISSVFNSTTEQEVEDNANKLRAKSEYAPGTTLLAKLNDKIVPRAKIIVKFRDSTKPAESALVDLLKVDVETDQTYRNETDNKVGLADLKKKIEKLKNYTEKSSNDEKAVFETLTPDQKKVLTELLKDFSDKAEKLEKGLKNKNNDEGDKNKGNNTESF